MKIVPRVSSAGIFYVVRRSWVYPKRYLSSGGIWSSGVGLDRTFSPPMHFNSPEEAAKEVKEKFGETQRIDFWEGK